MINHEKNQDLNYKELFESMHPGFFKREDIQAIPEEWVMDEMIINLSDYDPDSYHKGFDETVSFGLYTGSLDEIKKAADIVVKGWSEYFSGNQRIYCGYASGQVTSFCMIEDMGVHTNSGKSLKIGGPGCVGTLPQYRNLGIGLTMVNKVTQILKSEGYNYSYIHYTGVSEWYSKLGYKQILKWNKNGIIV